MTSRVISNHISLTFHGNFRNRKFIVPLNSGISLGNFAFKSESSIPHFVTFNLLPICSLNTRPNVKYCSQCWSYQRTDGGLGKRCSDLGHGLGRVNMININQNRQNQINCELFLGVHSMSLCRGREGELPPSLSPPPGGDWGAFRPSPENYHVRPHLLDLLEKINSINVSCPVLCECV